MTQSISSSPISHPSSFTRPCPVCASVASTFLYEKNGYPLLRCGGCGLVSTREPEQTNPLSPSEVEKLYQNRYPLEMFWKERPRKLKKSRAELKLVEKLVGTNPGGCPKGKLLDVGCSYGFFLEVARERDWQGQGVELSPVAARYARKESRLEVFNGRLQDASFAPNSFDVVTIRHVLEHIPEIEETLTEIRRILKPGGLVLVAVPNLNSLNYRLSGKDWWWIDPPTHWWYFNCKTLTQLLECYHFSPIHTSTHRADDQTIFHATLFSLNKRFNLAPRLRQIVCWLKRQTIPLDNHPSSSLLNHQWGKAEQLGEILYRLLRPLGWLVDRAGWGGEILIVATKKDGVN